MASVRINVSVPRGTFDELKKAIEPRKRSRFISKAIEDALQEQRAQRLALEYEEAAGEIRDINRDLEGTLSDGLD
jgi:metal-responsive CopG/Arc/MetJ family transcriptional regulator